jgi:hypothetical protein
METIKSEKKNKSKKDSKNKKEEESADNETLEKEDESEDNKGAITFRAALSANQAVSLCSSKNINIQESFKSPTGDNIYSTPFSRETIQTNFVWELSFHPYACPCYTEIAKPTTEDLSKKREEYVKIVHETILNILPVGGGQTSYKTSFAPQSVIVRITNSPNVEINNLWIEAESERKYTLNVERLESQIKIGKIDPKEIVVSGEILLDKELRETLENLGVICVLNLNESFGKIEEVYKQ